jgi:hypothetical protein
MDRNIMVGNRAGLLTWQWLRGKREGKRDCFLQSGSTSPQNNDEIIISHDAILTPAGNQAFSTQAFGKWALHIQAQHPLNLSSLTVLMSKCETMSTLHSGVRSI